LPACTTPDTIAPVLSSESATAITETSTVLSFTTSETGTAYYLVFESSVQAPDSATIIAQADSPNLQTLFATGSASVPAGTNSLYVTGLLASVSLNAYLVVVDAALNVSSVTTIPFQSAAAPDNGGGGGNPGDGGGPTFSSAKEITAFSIGDAIGVITGTSIEVLVPYGTDVTALSPTVSFSPLASLSPNSGDATDFTSPVTYTVTAEDATQQNYTVTVTIDAAPAPEPDLTAPVLSNESATAITDTSTVLSFSSDETGTVYYLIYDSSSQAPDSETILNLTLGGAIAVGSDAAIAGANVVSVAALNAGTSYIAYLVVRDSSSNVSSVSSVPFMTLLSISTCYVTDETGTTIIGPGSCSGPLAIGNTITSITDFAFAGTRITSLAFETGSVLESIGAGAFYRPEAVSTLGGSLTIPASVKVLGESSFAATLITSLYFETGSVLETISAGAFSSTYTLTGPLVIPATVKNIGRIAFAEVAITTLIFETGSVLASIGGEAFAINANLIGTLVIPASVTEIGINAFVTTNFACVINLSNVDTATTGLEALPACATPDTVVQTYQIGDLGPGGGNIFYYSASGFACGPTLAATCHYLEAAPTTGASPWIDAAYEWSGDTTTSVVTASAIGSGYQNTLAMVSQNNTAGKAGTISRAYRGPNNLTDWYLPSQDELNQMCKWARGQAWTSDATECDGSGAINSGVGAGGFGEYLYWSSTESYPFSASDQTFNNYGQDFDLKSLGAYVRQVRAF
jgi:hypothetical protein